MPDAAFSYRITAAQVGLARDPEFIGAGASARAEVLGWLVMYGLVEKDKDLAAGLDKDGAPLTPILPATRKYRRSAMGPADPNAPPLTPAYAVSRTRLLLEGKAVDEQGGYAEFYWSFDTHTGATWGRVLDFQRKGVGKANVSRDVIGVSLDLVTRVRAKVLARWAAYKANGMTSPVKPTVVQKPIAKIKVIGRTDFDNFTYGIGSAGGAERSKAALATGHSTGMYQVGPGKGLPAFGGPGTTGPQRPAKPAPKPVLKPTTTPPTLKPKPEAKAAARTARPSGPAVSAALDVTAKGAVAEKIKTALAAIDRVHGDGRLKRIPVLANDSVRTNGQFAYSGRTGEALDVTVSRKGKNPVMTTAHETGHFMEITAIPGHAAGRRDFAADPLFKGWLDAVRGSKAYSRLADSNDPPGKYVSYLLQPNEFWARSYAQYIATRSGDPIMAKELAAIREADVSAPRHWADDDFMAIADAIDLLFRGLGWLA